MQNDEYAHVKTLVRELHAPTKNVSRPPYVAGTPEESSSLLLPGDQQPTASIVQQSKNERKQSFPSSDQHQHDHHHHHHHHNHHHRQDHDQNNVNNATNLPIPSLIVTGVDQHDQQYNTNQRRFSQFYFGLRRFSNSHTALNRCSDSMGTLGHRALLQFIESNDLPGLKSFLSSRHLSVDDRDENGTTCLMVAASKGLMQFVRELLTRGAEVQAEDLDNWSALLFAAKNGHLEIVQLLVDHGADVEHHDMGGWTALMWSSYRGHTEIVAFLLEKGADIFAHGNYHLGSLLWAAGRGHTEIVRLLVQRGAKVNVGDKYGTTALIWACRKGNAEIVEILLKAGANVDTAGMYSWTALLVAVSGGHHECVSLLLERKPNVNALDKDGMTALTIACREGLHEIASALIASGAYVNIQDRAGDTPLIHAVKNGHRPVVETLLKRHADVDIQGKERKTALYLAVEKGHGAIVKYILASNPDLELSTKDGDTPLLRGVRNRHLEIVQMLLEKKAKVSATDRRGDTCLHIGMRARSKAIVEALLRNPKNSQLLYRANKAGETPYALDTSHQKTILGQVFGARRLNANEDSEGMLGYELYSSALADVLSEPTLSTPITVGLYAKWGSGKSFLLAKLRDEMISFARQWAEPSVKAPWLLVMVCWHLSVLCGAIIGLSTWSYIWGLSVSVVMLLFFLIGIQSLKIASQKYDIYWTYSFYRGVMKRLGRLRLIMQVAFCHPPGPNHSTQPMPVRFHFAEASSASQSGESSVGYMLAALFEAIEAHYGPMPTRLYRAFRPKPIKSSSGWKWRRMCCIPVIIMFELGFLGFVAMVSLLIIYYTGEDESVREGILFALYILGAILLAGFLANIQAWAKAFASLFFSQSRHLKRTLRMNEGAPLTALGAEVSIMTDMVKCLDAFTKQQSRLVGIVDALDTCDTERTLTVLNAIQTLLSSPNKPFVLLLAVDPHVIAKAAEANSRRLFTEGGIGGHDFLRNLVHLPVYLQNSGLRKVQRAQNTALLFRRTAIEIQQDDQVLPNSASARRLSNASEIMASNEKLRAPGNAPRTGSKKLKLSESIASSIGSNLHRLGQNPQGAIDLSKMVLTDDYFSDVNPRSMRRLMNVIYITVRLLKAFQIDFSWYRLSSWINLTEQWPLRASMIVLQHDENGDSIEDTASLQSLYEKVRIKIPGLREAASLLELDRDERKLEAFLQLHKHDLLVADLRIFLPFTINLDPYFRKVLKEDQQANEDEGIVIPEKIPMPPPRAQPSIVSVYQPLMSNPSNPFTQSFAGNQPGSNENTRRKSIIPESTYPEKPSIPDLMCAFPEILQQVRLSDLTVESLCSLLKLIEDLKPTCDKLSSALHENAINGRVLVHCDLMELKTILNLSFGHWEIFRLLITGLREVDKQLKNIDLAADTMDSYPVSFSERRQKTVMEKQVTLEEQMICGALQTLNEEAFEDVVCSERPSPTSGGPSDVPDIGYLQPTLSASASATNSPTMTRRDSVFKPINQSTTSSPNMCRRDSILKHSGSVKTEKRVSIKHDAPILMEYISEKRPPLKPTAARPASLLLSKGERPVLKLVRSPSIDHDSDEKSDSSATNKDDESIPLVQSAARGNCSDMEK